MIAVTELQRNPRPRSSADDGVPAFCNYVCSSGAHGMGAYGRRDSFTQVISVRMLLLLLLVFLCCLFVLLLLAAAAWCVVVRPVGGSFCGVRILGYLNILGIIISKPKLNSRENVFWPQALFCTKRDKNRRRPVEPGRGRIHHTVFCSSVVQQQKKVEREKKRRAPMYEPPVLVRAVESSYFLNVKKVTTTKKKDMICTVRTVRMIWKKDRYRNKQRYKQ